MVNRSIRDDGMFICADKTENISAILRSNVDETMKTYNESTIMVDYCKKTEEYDSSMRNNEPTVDTLTKQCQW